MRNVQCNHANSPQLLEIEKCIKQLKARAGAFLVEKYGAVSHANREYPLYRVIVGSAEKPRVLVSAGVHGHEPAGVVAVLAFLEQHASTYAKDLTLEVYPCLNPTGYAQGTRKTAAGIDLNRAFGRDSKAPELTAFLRCLSGRKEGYLAVIDNHQDVEEPDWPYPGPIPDGLYLYASAQKGDLFPSKLIAALPPESTFKGNDVYGDKCSNGVIDSTANAPSSPYAEGGDLEQYLFRAHRSVRCLTLETPGAWPLERAASLHLKAISAALKLLTEDNK
jgi:murein peptide amidase A